jgi:hypothetical protein
MLVVMVGVVVIVGVVYPADHGSEDFCVSDSSEYRPLASG